MLTLFDKYQSIIISLILVFYILNSIYIGSDNLSFVLFLFVVILQVLRMRKHIKRLSFIQLGVLLTIMAASLAGLVFIFMGLNHLISIGVLSFPDWMIIFIQIAFIIVFILGVTSAIRSLYQRFTHSKA